MGKEGKGLVGKVFPLSPVVMDTPMYEVLISPTDPVRDGNDS